jgi:DNA/RNA endonuclease YhcR with UshA esterase domain
MRAFAIAAALAFVAGPVTASSNPPIAPSQAIKNVGACMTVEGQASISPDSNRFGVDIALGDQDESGQFMVYVPSVNSFPDLDSLGGQTVDVTGVVLIDRGKAEIMLANPDLISVAGADPGKLVTCDND